MYLSYALFLQRTTKDLLQTVQPRPKAPFQVIPQLTFKARCLTFGKEQMSELTKWLLGSEQHRTLMERLLSGIQFADSAELKQKHIDRIQHDLKELEEKRTDLQTKLECPTLPERRKATLGLQMTKLNNQSEKKLATLQKVSRRLQASEPGSKKRKVIARTKIRDQVDRIARLLFLPPPAILKKWNGTLTTDGVTANWHWDKRQSKGKHSPTAETPHIPKEHLIAVDPGHVDLIAAVRLSSQNPKLDNGTSRRSILKNEKLNAMNKTEYKLPNREWRSKCGQLQRTANSHRMVKQLQLQPAIDTLSQCTSRTSYVDVYDRHIQARLSTSPAFRQLMALKQPRRWKFEVYQKEQRQAKTAATDLLGNLPRKSTWVIWGNGGFGPTSRSHAAAPNKKLRSLLNRHLSNPIVLISEYGSSQTSCCCHGPVKQLKKAKQTTRATVLQCKNCNRLLSRDFNAANAILDMFLETQNTRLPDWV